MPHSTTPTANIHDPTSAAYKKLRRQHLKTTRHRDHTDSRDDWSPFRAAEKRYKACFPPPDLSSVLDLVLLDQVRVHAEGIRTSAWVGSVDGGVVPYEEMEISLEGSAEDGKKKAYMIPSIPGLVILPSFVSPAAQRSLVRWALRDQACAPNETNLDVHYLLPPEGLWRAHLNTHNDSSPAPNAHLIYPRVSPPTPMSTPALTTTAPGPRTLIANTPASPETFAELAAAPKPPPTPSASVRPIPPSALIRKLRWANIGWSYHWGSKQYDFARGKGTVASEVREVCRAAVRAVQWGRVFGDNAEQVGEWGEGGADWDQWEQTYEPDAGIVNFYQKKDTLMAHVDRSEVCATSPLVSISLGSAAIILIGGLTRDIAPAALLLRSGDVVIMAGPACRRAYHGVPRILEDTLPPHLRVGAEEYQNEHEGKDDWSVFGAYLEDCARININVRQVFPKDFAVDVAAAASSRGAG